MGCESRSRAFLKYDRPPKHARLGLLLFIYPTPPLPSLFAVAPFHSAYFALRLPCRSLFFSPVSFYSPFFSCRARSGIDRCHKRTNTSRACQRAPMSLVIVISTLIRATVRTSEAFATACAILSVIHALLDISEGQFDCKSFNKILIDRRAKTQSESNIMREKLI